MTAHPSIPGPVTRSSPPAPATAPPAAAPSALLLWVMCSAALLLALAGTSGLALRHIRAQADELDDLGLVQAEDAFGALVEQQRNHLLASARLLAEDTRIRSTTMTTGFDEGTIRDVLNDLKVSTSASALAVLDGMGKVRAVTGADGLRGVDLGSSPVIETAQKEPASTFWLLPDSLLLIGVAPIRSGPRITAFLLLGSTIGPPQLAGIEKSLKVLGAVFSGDRLVSAVTRDDATLDLLRKANAFADGASHVVSGPGGDAVTRVTRTSASATGARVAWLVPRHAHSPHVRALRIATLAPPLLAALMLGIALFKLRTQKGGNS